MLVSELWQHLFDQCRPRLDQASQKTVELILQHGCLASRIIDALKDDYRRENLRAHYRLLADCLLNNRLYLP